MKTKLAVQKMPDHRDQPAGEILRAGLESDWAGRKLTGCSVNLVQTNYSLQKLVSDGRFRQDHQGNHRLPGW